MKLSQAESMARIASIVAADPGGRGIGPLVRPGAIEAAAETLLAARRVVICSGFYIPSAGVCENDGPPGVMALGSALADCGRSVGYLTDSRCANVFRALRLEPLFVDKLPDDFQTDTLVAIERVGRTSDGTYRNMRGIDISAWTAPLDDYFLNARQKGIATIGVGDGGNEIGMGNVRELVQTTIANGAVIASTVEVDHLVVAGVSNWGAWGVVAGLSLMTHSLLLPTVERARDQLAACMDAGAVDGRTGRAELSVDGLAWEIHAQVLEQLRDVVAAAIL